MEGRNSGGKKQWGDVCHVAVIVFLGLALNTATGCDIGTANPGSHTTTTGATTDGRSFFIDGIASTCCGSLANFKLYASSAGTVTAMLWRPTTGNNYRLEYSEDFNVAVGLNTPIPTTTVAVEVGDVVGWKTAGAEIIPYSAIAGSSTQNQLLTPTLNAEVPWGQTPDTTSTYAFGAVVVPNDAPTVTAGSETIADTDTSQTVHTLVIADTDTADLLADTTVVISNTNPVTTDFTIGDDGVNFVIQSGASLSDGTYELEITAKDVCEETGTATVTITVQNPPPVYDPSTPANTNTGTLSDATTAATLIYSFLVTDTEPVTCTSDNALFEIRENLPNKELWLKDITATDLNYDNSATQGVTISCTDGNTAVLRDPFIVNLSDEPPTVADLGGSTSVGDNTPIGTVLHQFTATDQDDVVTCTVNNAAFSVTALDGAAGTQKYDIATAATLTSGDVHNLILSCDDGENTAVTGTYDVTVTDAVPVFSPTTPDTSYSGTISDVTTMATSIYAFSVVDTGGITCTTDNTKFEIIEAAPNHEIWLKNVATTDLNFDNDPTETMTISCEDGSANTITRDYSVDISDEPPALSNLGATTGPVGDLTASGTSIYQYTVVDQDDVISCSISDADFSIEALNPATAGTQLYDIKTAAGLNQDTTASYSLTISCNDNTNAAVTNTLTVTISDEQPTLTGLDVTTTASVSDGSQAAETTLVSFTVTDANDETAIPIACVVQAPNTALFQITGTPPNLDVKTVVGQTLESASAPYEVVVNCDDDEAANTVSGTVTVPLTNTPPVFVGLPATLSPAISDATAADISLYSFSVTDSASATITCTPSATAPYDDDIELRGTSPDFEIWVLAANDLKFDSAGSIPVTISCDDTVTTITEVFNLELFDEDPVWTGLPAGTPFSSLPDSQSATEPLLTFSVADSDDTINCVVDTGSAEATSFNVIAGTPPEFVLWYQGSPPANLDFANAQSHDVPIVCDDGASYNHTETYTVNLENAPPTFVNLPDASATISESETTKTPIYTFSVTDTTRVVCYLADTAIAAGIEPLENPTGTLPITEYVIYAWHTTGFDADKAPGTITVEVTCGDKETTITETLTVTITNDAPVITNPGGTYTVSEEETGEVQLKTLNFEKFDENDVTCTMTNNDGGPFDVSGKQVVKTAGTLDFETKPSYSLEVTCTDGSLSTTDTVTVNVENAGPEMTNLGTTVEIAEEQVAELSIFQIDLSEDATDCSQVAPVESEFVIKYVPATASWSAFYVSQDVAGKKLQHSVKPSYALNIVCEDAGGVQGAQKTLTVNVLDNAAPVFDNIGGEITTKHEILAKDFPAGTPVFTVQATDPSTPADDITYNLISCEPAATCNFTLTPNGDIVPDIDLHSHPHDTYTFIIQATDEYNTDAPPAELILKLNEINTPPVFTNLPKKDKVGVLENKHAAGDTVFTMSVDDVDAPATDTLAYHCDFPDGGDTYFELVPDTGEIITKEVINYEEISLVGQLEYRVECYVNDGYVDSDVETFTIRINDENEEPTFTTPTWTLNQPDEGGHGTEVGCPDFDGDIQDEDFHEDHKYTMECPNGDGVFDIDRHTGCIRMLKEWDLDVAPNRQAQDTVTCTVTATDKEGLETTTNVVINIDESDDNKPYHDQTSYHFCATEGSTSGTLGSVTASDKDVQAKHRRHTYSFVEGGPFGDDGNGGLTYGDVSGYAKGTTFQRTLRVTDEAGNFDDAPVTIMICDPPTAASAAAASSSSSSSSSSSTSDLLLWLIPTILLGLLALGLAAYCLRRFCCRGSCRPCFKSAARAKVIRAVQPMRVVQKRALVQRQVVKKVVPVKMVQRPVTMVQTPIKTMQVPVQKVMTPQPKPAPMITGELLMNNFYAREKANIGQDLPLN